MVPPIVRAILEAHLHTTVQHVILLTGGMINQVARVECTDGPVLVKWHPDAPSGMFAAEADGLQALAATSTVQVPSVLLHDTSFLALEFLSPVPPTDAPTFNHRFASQLASLHRAPVQKPLYGWEQDNFLGVFPQNNTPPSASWADFCRDHRLLPQIERARQAGHLSASRERLLATTTEQLPLLLADLPPEHSLLHGDLWSGNYLCLSDNTPALIDPAVYVGPREMELAYIELFGGFPSGFVDAYNAVWPLPSDYPRRRPVHQLYPLLVHLNCFGEKYGPAVERACQDALT